MPNPRLASRYAKALIDLAIERGQLEEVFADMKWLQSVCKSNRDFVNVLRSPVIKADVKKKIVEAVTKMCIRDSSSCIECIYAGTSYRYGSSAGFCRRRQGV